jgi:hypothetical protein
VTSLENDDYVTMGDRKPLAASNAAVRG